MMTRLFILICYFGICHLNAQNIDKDLLEVQHRLDTIQSFSALVELNVDISFINIPVKHAKIEYTKNEETKVFSEDFVLIPKKGLDVSLYQLFKNPFITVDRGTVSRHNKTYKALNIIPTNRKADFSIATVLIDTFTNRIVEYEINTKKDGSYLVSMQYTNDISLLPISIEVKFEIERVRIPLKYMGKDADIDKDSYKSEEVKTGTIHIGFNYTEILYFH